MHETLLQAAYVVCLGVLPFASAIGRTVLDRRISDLRFIVCAGVEGASVGIAVVLVCAPAGGLNFVDGWNWLGWATLIGGSGKDITAIRRTLMNKFFGLNLQDGTESNDNNQDRKKKDNDPQGAGVSRTVPTESTSMPAATNFDEPKDPDELEKA